MRCATHPEVETSLRCGIGLAIVASIAVVISYLISILFPWGLAFRMLDLLALALGIFIAVTRLR